MTGAKTSNRQVRLLVLLMLLLVSSVLFAVIDLDGGSEVSPRAIARRVLRGLPIMRLHLAEQDRAHFLDIHEHFGDGTRPEGVKYYQERNQWRSASLTWEGRTFPIKIKSHGRTPYRQRIGEAISFSVKVSNRGQIRGAHRFTLVISPRVFAENELLQEMARTVGNLADRQIPIALQYNDGLLMPYFFEYRLNDSYMDMLGWPSLRLFAKRLRGKSPTLAHVAQHETAAEVVASIDQGLEAYTDKDLSPEFLREIRARYRDLNRAILEGDVEKVSSFFAPEYIAAFEAIRLLSGFGGHGTGNNFIYYDTASGLLYPIWHRDFFVGKLSDRPTLERMDYNQYRFPLSEMFSRSDSIRQAKYRILYEKLTTPEYVQHLAKLYNRTVVGPLPRGQAGFLDRS